MNRLILLWKGSGGQRITRVAVITQFDNDDPDTGIF